MLTLTKLLTPIYFDGFSTPLGQRILGKGIHATPTIIESKVIERSLEITTANGQDNAQFVIIFPYFDGLSLNLDTCDTNYFLDGSYQLHR